MELRPAVLRKLKVQVKLAWAPPSVDSQTATTFESLAHRFGVCRAASHRRHESEGERGREMMEMRELEM